MITYIYCRVSTDQQNNNNQIQEIEQAGFEPDAIYCDTVSGKIPAMDRPEFKKLMDTISRTRKPKRLVVAKLDRLGRDAADIMSTVRALTKAECSVKVLQFGELDVTSAAGKMVLGTLSSLAELERDILIERTRSGIERARREGKHLGRPPAADAETVSLIRQKLNSGASVSRIALDHGVSRGTVQRIRSGTSVYQIVGAS